MTADEEIQRARTALYWEMVRGLRDARLRANARLALHATLVVLAMCAMRSQITWLAHFF